jgi:uncharacterized protein (DUF1800 family)
MKTKFPSLFFLLILILSLGFTFFKSQPAQSFVVDPKIQHVVERLSFGPTPEDLARVTSQGIELYIKQQLSPQTLPDSPYLQEKLTEFKTLNLTPVQLFAEYSLTRGKKAQLLSEEERKQEREKLASIKQEAIAAHLLRAIYSPKQLEEVMTYFWLNHFNVFIGKGQETRLWVGNYENEAIRPYVLGNFRNLLEATAKHPAMLYYLDNWRNTDPQKAGKNGQFQGINENYARELMELHTLGVDGGYTQEDVTTLARILTGWGVSLREKGNFYFDDKRHDFSDKIFLKQTIKGSGITEVEQVLDILANHPATARHLSYKLAQYFLADEPPNSLVEKLTQTFLKTKGNIRSVLETLFSSSEFFDPKYYHHKFKTPYQYIISIARATGVKNPNLKRLNGMLEQLNMSVYGCPTPDGYKNIKSAWLNPDAMLRRLSFTTAIANGNLNLEEKKMVNSEELMNTLGNQFSAQTKEVINNTPPRLKSAVILGSPEMMHR